MSQLRIQISDNPKLIVKFILISVKSHSTQRLICNEICYMTQIHGN